MNIKIEIKLYFYLFDILNVTRKKTSLLSNWSIEINWGWINHQWF